MYFQCLQRVEFRDTDAAGIAHFSVFFNWMERAEHRMLRHFGWSVVHKTEEQTISWPRVDTSCNFRRPLKFEEVFGVELTVEKLGRSSATYQFRFLSGPDVSNLKLADNDSDRLLTHGQVTNESWFANRPTAAEGSIKAVCCIVQHGKKPEPIEIPNDLRQHLESLAQ